MRKSFHAPMQLDVNRFSISTGTLTHLSHVRILNPKPKNLSQKRSTPNPAPMSTAFKHDHHPSNLFWLLPAKRMSWEEWGQQGHSPLPCRCSVIIWVVPKIRRGIQPQGVLLPLQTHLSLATPPPLPWRVA